MTDIFRTAIVPASVAPLARMLMVNQFDLLTPLSPTGAAPATHFISSGMIPERFGPILSDPQTAHEAATAAGHDVTLAQITEALNASDVSEDSPSEAQDRLGLLRVVEEA